jgi:hypothetical protein
MEEGPGPGSALGFLCASWALSFPSRQPWKRLGRCLDVRPSASLWSLWGWLCPEQRQGGWGQPSRVPRCLGGPGASPRPHGATLHRPTDNDCTTPVPSQSSSPSRCAVAVKLALLVLSGLSVVCSGYRRLRPGGRPSRWPSGCRPRAYRGAAAEPGCTAITRSPLRSPRTRREPAWRFSKVEVGHIPPTSSVGRD